MEDKFTPSDVIARLRYYRSQAPTDVREDILRAISRIEQLIEMGRI